HRSGISHSYYPFLRTASLDQSIQELRHIRPEGEFRASYVYSNLLYAALGKLIEAVSGSSWQKLMSERLLAPLQMRRSFTSPYEIWDASHVAPTFLGSAPCPDVTIDHARDRNVAMPH